MTGKRRHWHRRWVVDLAAGTAAHDSGFAVAFAPGIALPRPLIGAYAYADGVGEWTGTPLGGDDAVHGWLLCQPALRDTASRERRIGRLMEEAGRVWARAQADAARGQA